MLLFAKIDRLGAQTGQDGIATAPTLTANSTLGSFSVIATVPGLGASANFALTIAPPVTAIITPSAGTPQAVAVSTGFAALKAKAEKGEIELPHFRQLLKDFRADAATLADVQRARLATAFAHSDALKKLYQARQDLSVLYINSL